MKEFVRQAASRVMLPLTYFDQLLRPGIRVLMYHRVIDSPEYDQLTVSPEIFDRQMQYLGNNFNVVSLESAVKTLFYNKKNSNSVVITFDDGYLDNLENALPILEKYNLPATIYLTTDFCEQTARHPRYIAQDKRLHLDWDEVQEMNEVNNVTFGSHTLSHPYLSRIDRNSSDKEIRKSKDIIESKLNASVKHFCYPSGDYGDREIDSVKKSGYETAVTVSPGKNRTAVSPFEINRTEVTQKDTAKDLFLKLNGSFDLMHQVLHWKRKKEFKKLTV